MNDSLESDEKLIQEEVIQLLTELNQKGVVVRDDVKELGSNLLHWRRHVHRLAETSFTEYQTAAFVESLLRGMEGVTEVRTGLAKTGLTAIIRGTKPLAPGQSPKLIMCRADMDALPIPEATGLPFAATNGNSHACGHDGHVAMLLAAAACLGALRSTFSGAVMLLFQPAEEGGGGAREMLKEPSLLQATLAPGPSSAAAHVVSECYGIHLWNTEGLGLVGATAGPNLANSDRWSIEVVGSGGHGAMPHETVDPILVASHIVVALQSVVSRNVDPLASAVVTVGSIHGGHAPNVIPGRCQLVGTARSLTAEVQDLVIASMKRLAEGVAAGFGATVEFHYTKNYPATVSTAPEVQHVRRAAEKIVGGDRVVGLPPVMGGEDFSFFLQQLPGCFFFVGSSSTPNKTEAVPHHRADFIIHEGALFIGASIWIELILDRLS